jgi:hypothetical protein
MMTRILNGGVIKSDQGFESATFKEVAIIIIYSFVSRLFATSPYVQAIVQFYNDSRSSASFISYEVAIFVQS